MRTGALGRGPSGRWSRPPSLWTASPRWSGRWGTLCWPRRCPSASSRPPAGWHYRALATGKVLLGTPLGRHSRWGARPPCQGARASLCDPKSLSTHPKCRQKPELTRSGEGAMCRWVSTVMTHGTPRRLHRAHSWPNPSSGPPVCIELRLRSPQKGERPRVPRA